MDLIVSRQADAWQAAFGASAWPCAVGRSGVRVAKSEGDGATPVGAWPLRRLLYRPDRLEPPLCCLAAEPIAADDAWCDDPGHAAYNRAVKLPFDGRHERLWRDDRLYDLLVVLGHNDDPPVPGAGSCIFLHVARPGYRPTEGCIALAAGDLLTLLGRIDPDSRVLVEACRR